MDFHKAFGARFLLLLPAAFCIFIILDSQDKALRLGAVLALILIEQLREWLLVGSIRELGAKDKTNKKEGAK
ncbi:MAG: hypothetical protein N3E51_00345 [Candidatus Micrarchaeota archaeon]|nr:hypothetical protein [Candidatus Micrarchaeota archaeon]